MFHPTPLPRRPARRPLTTHSSGHQSVTCRGGGGHFNLLPNITAARDTPPPVLAGPRLETPEHLGKAGCLESPQPGPETLREGREQGVESGGGPSFQHREAPLPFVRPPCLHGIGPSSRAVGPLPPLCGLLQGCGFPRLPPPRLDHPGP